MTEQNEIHPVPPRRAIYLLPNLLTTGTVFSGFYGIIAAIDGHYPSACVAVFVAALLDGMDGRLARLTHTESEFGKHYDSLADMVAFGVAPAIIVYQWGLKTLVAFGWVWGKIGWLAAFVYMVAAALRLARFNVATKSTDRRFFDGLPSPSAAGLVVSMIWVLLELQVDSPLALGFSALITVAAGLLMVSRLSYYSFKELAPRGRIPFAYVFLIPTVFVIIALNPPAMCFSIASCYALSGLVISVFRRSRKRGVLRPVL